METGRRSSLPKVLLHHPVLLYWSRHACTCTCATESNPREWTHTWMLQKGKKKKSVLRARLISRVDAERAKISFAHVECLSKIFFFPLTSYEWPELKRLSSLPASLKSLCLGRKLHYLLPHCTYLLSSFTVQGKFLTRVSQFVLWRFWSDCKIDI